MSGEDERTVSGIVESLKEIDPPHCFSNMYREIDFSHAVVTLVDIQEYF